MDVDGMARTVVFADEARGRNTFSPEAVFSAMRKGPDECGNRTRMSWKGLLYWHTHSCKEGSCIPAGSLWDNVRRCMGLRVLLLTAIEGIRPSLWVHSPVKQEDGVKKPYPLTSELQAEARKKLTKAEEDGTAERLHKRAVTRLRKQGIPTSSSFMVVKWKAIRGKQASAARVEWAEKNPTEAALFIAGSKSANPPQVAFEPKWRLVYNFKALNAATIKLPMAYGMEREAVAKIQPGDTMLVLDIKDGFTAVPVAAKDSPLLHFVTDGYVPLEPRRMPFGYRLAPFFFCLFSAAVADALQAGLPEPLALHMYMDDALLVWPSSLQRDGVQVRSKAIQIMLDCGAPVSSEKIEGPADRVRYLGVQLEVTDTEVQVSIPEDKWFTLTELFKMIKKAGAAAEPGGHMTKGTLDSLLGKLGALAVVLPLQKADLATLYAIKRTAGGKPWDALSKLHKVSFTPPQRAALLALMEQVQRHPRRTAAGAPASSPRTRFFGAVDASGEGGLGGFVTRSGDGRSVCFSERIRGAQPGDEWVGLSTWLELLAIERAVKVVTSLRQAGDGWCGLTLASDSQSACALVRKGYSTKSPEINAICRRLAELLARDEVALEVVWVSRARNWIADQLSHPDSPDAKETMRRKRWPTELRQMQAQQQAWEGGYLPTASGRGTEAEEPLRAHRNTHSPTVRRRTESMASTGLAEHQPDSMGKSVRPGRLDKAGVLASDQAIPDLPARKTAGQHRQHHRVRVPERGDRAVGLPRSWEIPGQAHISAGVVEAENAGSDQGGQDEMAACSFHALASFKRDTVQAATDTSTATRHLRHNPNDRTSGASQLCGSSVDGSVLGHDEVKGAVETIKHDDRVVHRQAGTTHHGGLLSGQNSPSGEPQSGGGISGRRPRVSRSTAGEIPSRPRKQARQAPTAATQREGSSTASISGCGNLSRIDQTRRQHVLATSRTGPGIDTQAGRLGSRLQDPSAALHRSERSNNCHTEGKGSQGDEAMNEVCESGMGNTTSVVRVGTNRWGEPPRAQATTGGGCVCQMHSTYHALPIYHVEYALLPPGSGVLEEVGGGSGKSWGDVG